MDRQDQLEQVISAQERRFPARCCDEATMAQLAHLSPDYTRTSPEWTLHYSCNLPTRYPDQLPAIPGIESSARILTKATTYQEYVTAVLGVPARALFHPVIDAINHLQSPDDVLARENTPIPKIFLNRTHIPRAVSENGKQTVYREELLPMGRIHHTMDELALAAAQVTEKALNLGYSPAIFPAQSLGKTLDDTEGMYVQRRALSHLTEEERIAIALSLLVPIRMALYPYAKRTFVDKDLAAADVPPCIYNLAAQAFVYWSKLAQEQEHLSGLASDIQDMAAIILYPKEMRQIRDIRLGMLFDPVLQNSHQIPQRLGQLLPHELSVQLHSVFGTLGHRLFDTSEQEDPATGVRFKGLMSSHYKIIRVLIAHRNDRLMKDFLDYYSAAVFRGESEPAMAFIAAWHLLVSEIAENPREAKGTAREKALSLADHLGFRRFLPFVGQNEVDHFETAMRTPSRTFRILKYDDKRWVDRTGPWPYPSANVMLHHTSIDLTTGTEICHMRVRAGTEIQIVPERAKEFNPQRETRRSCAGTVNVLDNLGELVPITLPGTRATGFEALHAALRCLNLQMNPKALPELRVFHPQQHKFVPFPWDMPVPYAGRVVIQLAQVTGHNVPPAVEIGAAIVKALAIGTGENQEAYHDGYILFRSLTPAILGIKDPQTKDSQANVYQVVTALLQCFGMGKIHPWKLISSQASPLPDYQSSPPRKPVTSTEQKTTRRVKTQPAKTKPKDQQPVKVWLVLLAERLQELVNRTPYNPDKSPKGTNPLAYQALLNRARNASDKDAPQMIELYQLITQYLIQGIIPPSHLIQCCCEVLAQFNVS